MTSGLVLVDKEEGVTSAGVIRALKGALGDAKVGHVGTLDPFVSGLLPLCVGEATKVARYLLLEEKAYTGTIQLGVETDTLDRTGTVTARAPVPALDGDFARRLGDALFAQTGSRWQVREGDGEGRPSLGQMKAAKLADNDARIRELPVVKAALAAFPDARLVEGDNFQHRSNP